MPKLNALVAGSTGYIGTQLIKILVKHKHINIKYLCGNSSVGKSIVSYDKSLSKYKLPKIKKFNKNLLNDVDVIFTALPNGEAQDISKHLNNKNILIDLAADFRLEKASEYKKWYKQKHRAVKLIKKSIYSLPEINMENTQTISKTPKLKLDFKDSKYATGRRKTSIAKVWLKKGSGKIYVNGKLFSDYFADETHKMQITRPFEIINQSTDYDVRCSVKGGGPTGQAGAMVHGIAKALVLFDENLKGTLKTEKLTTRDSRAVERKKPGRRKARRSFQFSKR